MRILVLVSTISVRLPDEIEKLLNEESRRSDMKRSEMVREAVSQYLIHRQKQRFMAEYVEEMRQAYADPEVAEDARRIRRDFAGVDMGLERLIEEEHAAGIDPEERWWR